MITRRVYNLGLDEFFEWYGREPRPGFTKATVAAWRVALEARGLGAVSINVRITAVRKLAVEAADNGLLAPELASGITRVKGVASKGVRLGNWLSVRQAQTLLNAPVAGFAEVVARPLQQLARGRTAQRSVSLVHRRQQRDVLPRVALREAVAPVRRRLHCLAALVPRDEARRLRPAQSCHLFHVTPDQSTASPFQFLIVLHTQRLIYPTVNLRPITPLNSTSLLASKNARICSRLNPSATCMLTINPQHAGSRPLQAHLV